MQRKSKRQFYRVTLTAHHKETVSNNPRMLWKFDYFMENYPLRAASCGVER